MLPWLAVAVLVRGEERTVAAEGATADEGARGVAGLAPASTMAGKTTPNAAAWSHTRRQQRLLGLRRGIIILIER